MSDTPPVLSTVVADFSANRQQLIDLLATYPSAQTALAAQSVLMLLEMVAGGHTVDQFTIERAVQELRLDDMSDPRSVYKAARSQGVPILRYRPGMVTALLTNASPGVAVAIPAYSQFSVNGINFFNPAPISFLAGMTSLQAQLVEGTPVEFDYVASGQPYQVLRFGTGFNLSNDYVRLIVGGAEYSRVTDGLWNYQTGQQVFNDSTTPDGGVELLLGSSINGVQPTINTAMQAIAYQVSGTANTNATGLSVAYSGSSAISGSTVTGIAGSEKDRSLDYYRFSIPKIAPAAKRCIIRNDFAILTQYAQVREVRPVGEADVARGDYRWNTTVGLVTRTSATFSQQQKDAFIAYATANRTVYGFNLIWIDPEPVLVRPIILLIVDPAFDLASVVGQVQSNITAFYANRLDTPILGRTWYPGGLSSLILSVPGVVDFDVSSPTEPVACSYKQYVDLDPAYSVTAQYLAP